MLRIVLTGGPGAGKTATLKALGDLGHTTGDDAARAIIRARKQKGLSPRPDPQTFAQLVFEQEVAAYRAAGDTPVFLERGVVDAVSLLLGAGALDVRDVDRVLTDYRYQAVFIFPPWEEIYCTDEERDHTFEHAAKVYDATLAFYRQIGYEPIEVPRSGVRQRANFILSDLDSV